MENDNDKRKTGGHCNRFYKSTTRDHDGRVRVVDISKALGADAAPRNGRNNEKV